MPCAPLTQAIHAFRLSLVSFSRCCRSQYCCYVVIFLYNTLDNLTVRLHFGGSQFTVCADFRWGDSVWFLVGWYSFFSFLLINTIMHRSNSGALCCCRVVELNRPGLCRTQIPVLFCQSRQFVVPSIRGLTHRLWNSWTVWSEGTSQWGSATL